MSIGYDEPNLAYRSSYFLTMSSEVNFSWNLFPNPFNSQFTLEYQLQRMQAMQADQDQPVQS